MSKTLPMSYPGTQVRAGLFKKTVTLPVVLVCLLANPSAKVRATRPDTGERMSGCGAKSNLLLRGWRGFEGLLDDNHLILLALLILEVKI